MHHHVILSDPDGGSRFGDAETALLPVEFAPPAAPFDVSEPGDAVSWRFCRLPAGWFGDWHPAPCRQWFVQLSGELEVVVTSGEVRHLRAGDTVLLEDVDGRGHTTRVVGDADVLAMFVRLPEAAAA